MASVKSETAQKPLRVLVIEDSVDDFDLLVTRLRRGGYDTTALRVENAPDMSKALRDHPWDVVIADDRLPAFDSASALKLLKQTGLDVPLIIVSGTIQHASGGKAMLEGAEDYLHKDNLTRLIPAIERSVASARERRQKRDALKTARELDARLFAIANNFPGALFQLSLDTASEEIRVNYLSPGAARMFSGAVGTSDGASIAFLSELTPTDLQRLRAELFEAAKTMKDVRFEAPLPDLSGPDPRWVKLSATPRRAEDGTILWDGIITDVTVEKDVEEQMATSERELRELAQHMDSVKESERAHVAREIHDEIGGALTLLKATLAGLRREMQPDMDFSRRLDDLDKLVGGAMEASVRIARALRPSILDYGLVPALEAHAREFQSSTGLICSFQANREDLPLSEGQSTALYRIFQEALTNVIKHANASRVDASLFADKHEVTLEIRDNGVGLKATDWTKRDSFGLRGINERVRAFGGWADISGQAGQGTTVMVSIPLTASAPPSTP